MTDLDKLADIVETFFKDIAPLLPKKPVAGPAAKPEPDPRLTWEGIKDSDGDTLRITGSAHAGFVVIEAIDNIDGDRVHVRANAADLGQLCFAAWQARMNLKGFEAAVKPNSLWGDTQGDNQVIEAALLNITAIGEKS